MIFVHVHLRVSGWRFQKTTYGYRNSFIYQSLLSFCSLLAKEARRRGGRNSPLYAIMEVQVQFVNGNGIQARHDEETDREIATSDATFLIKPPIVAAAVRCAVEESRNL